LGEKNQILYVGKAKNLQKRVNSYTQENKLSGRIKQLVATAQQLKFQVLTSELEALLVEAELINTHQPPFNILLKDDKSPLYVLITKEKFPRVMTVRKRDLNKKQISVLSSQFSTFGPYQSGSKLKQVLKLIRPIFKWCETPESGKACFYYHLNLCSGACSGQISPQNYQANIKNLTLFLQGKKRDLLKKLTLEMKQAAVIENFELAQEKKSQWEAVVQVLTNSRLQPDLVLPQLQTETSQEALTRLQKILSDYLSLPKKYSLQRIEGYDVSNTSGQLASVSMVVFSDGQADKKNYRLFNIKTLNTPNDYQMMKEAIARRQKHPEWGEPNLLLIDGGRGQLRAAFSVWQWSTPIVSLVKNPDRLVIPLIKDGKITGYKILNLANNLPVLHLLQQIRDEAHRFSKKQHSKRRMKGMFD